MNYQKLLSPRYCFDKAVGKAWAWWGSELRQPEREPAFETPKDLRDICIEWPTRYGWAPGSNWGDPILSGLQRYVAVRRVDIPQLPNNAIQIRLFLHGEEHKVIIDFSDKYEAVYDDYLRDSLLYFKMQFRNGGYEDSRIITGLYVPSAGLDMYHFLPRLRRIRDDSSQVRFDVYGRFGMYRPRGPASGNPGDSSWRVIEIRAEDVRARAINILETQNRFLYQGGGKLLALTRSLCEVARSKVVIDLPGRGPFCHRLVDYLSIGSCIVAYPHGATLHPPLVPGKHIAYCRPDFSDLVEICHYYLTHDQEREAMVQASRDYFDTYLHRDCITAYYLECLASRLGLPLKERSLGDTNYDGRCVDE